VIRSKQHAVQKQKTVFFQIRTEHWTKFIFGPQKLLPPVLS